jgi:hypothetical protein
MAHADTVQAELARYFAHLATVQTNLQGEVSNGSSRDFTFNFGSSTTLTVQMMEKLEVSSTASSSSTSTSRS